MFFVTLCSYGRESLSCRSEPASAEVLLWSNIIGRCGASFLVSCAIMKHEAYLIRENWHYLRKINYFCKKYGSHWTFFAELFLSLCRRRKSVADILRKRLALFHPLNLDNSLNIGIDRNVPPAMDYILLYIYCQGCEPFSIFIFRQSRAQRRV